MQHTEQGRGLDRQALAQLLYNFMLHCATGVVTVVVHYSLMYALLAVGTAALAASSIGFAGGALSRFLLSYHHVFLTTRSQASAAMRFSVSLGLQFVLNALLLWCLLAWSLTTWPAQLTTTVALTILNYAMYRFWVFA